MATTTDLTIELGLDTLSAIASINKLGKLADDQLTKQRKIALDDSEVKRFATNLNDAMKKASTALNFDSAFAEANDKVSELENSLTGAVLAFGKTSPIVQELVADLTRAKQEAKQFEDAINFVDNIKLDLTFGDGLAEARKEAERLQGELAQIIATQGSSGAAYDDAVKKLKAARAEADRLDQALKDAGAAAQDIAPPTNQGFFANFGAQIKSARDEASAGGGVFSDIATKFGELASPVGLATAGIGVLTTGLVSAYSAGTELNAAFLDMQAKTGVTGKEFELLKQAAEDAFVGGVGGSVAEASKVISEAQFRFGDVFNPQEIGEFTKQSQALANLYDKDVNEVLRLSSPFVKQFGLDGAEAGRLVSLAMSQAGSAQDDVLDSLSEYSQLAQEAGFSAQTFTEVLTRGTREGVFNTDKIADALKETQIRLKAGDFATAFDDLSKSSSGAEKVVVGDVRKILDAAQSGQISIAEGLSQSAALIEKGFKAGNISESMRSQLQIAISGTPAEDLGTEMYGKIFGAPFNVAEIDARAKQAADQVSKAIGSYTTFEAVQKKLSATFQVASANFVNFADSTLAPAFGAIIESVSAIYEEVAPILGNVFQDLGSAFGSVYDVLKPIIAGIAGLFGAGLLNAINTTVAILSGIGEFLSTFFKRVKDSLAPIFSAISQIFGSTGESALNLSEIFSAFGDIVELTADAAASFGGLLAEFLVTPFQLLAGFVGNVVQFLQRFIGGSRDAAGAATQLGNSAQKTVGFFATLGAGLKAIPALLEGVRAGFVTFKDIIFDIYETITNVFENGVGGTVSKLIDLFKGAGSRVGDSFQQGFNNASIFKALEKEAENVKLKFPDLDTAAQNKSIDDFKKKLYDAVNNKQINESQKKALEDAVQELYALRTKKSAEEQAQEKQTQALKSKGAEDAKKAEEELLAKLKERYDLEKQRNDLALQRFEAEQSADGVVTDAERLAIAQKKLELDTASMVAYQEIYKIVNDMNGVAVETQVRVSEASKNSILAQILGLQKDINNQKIALGNVGFDKDALVKQLEAIINSFDNTTIDTQLSAVIGIDVDNAQTLAITRDFARLLGEATSAGVGGAIAGVVQTQFDTAITGAQSKITALNEFIAQQTEALNSITDADQKKRTEEQIAKARTEAQNLAKIVQDARLKVEDAGFKRRLALAADQNERELILQTQALAKELNDTINGAQLTAEEKERITREYLNKERKLIEDYRRRNERGFVTGLTTAANTAVQALAQAFAQPFTFTIDVEAENQAKERIAELTEEQNKLFQALKEGRISFADYQTQLAAISDEMKTLQDGMGEIDIWGQVASNFIASMDTMKTALATTYQSMIVEQDKYNAQVIELNNRLSEIHDTSSQEYVDTLKKRDDAMKKSADLTNTAYGALVGGLVASTAKMVAEQKPFLHALVLSLFDALQAMVPIWTAMITGFSLASAESVATAGALGVAKALAIIGIMSASVALARAAVKKEFGFKKGGYTGDGSPDQVKGAVHAGEVVFENPIVGGQLKDVLAIRSLLQSGVRASDLVSAYKRTSLGGMMVSPEGKLIMPAHLEMAQQHSNITAALQRTQVQTKVAINTMFELQREQKRQDNETLLKEVKSLKRIMAQMAQRYESHSYGHLEVELNNDLLTKRINSDIQLQRVR